MRAFTLGREVAAAPGFLERALRDATLSRLEGLERGALAIEDAGARHELGRSPADDPLSATVVVRRPSFWSSLALRGSVGAGESWMRGDWDCDDLASAVRIVLRHREVMDGLDSGLARLAAPALRALHALRGNSRAGARRNISAHYDLGNDFFGEILDETMTYSCGIFESAEATLADASRAKIARLCRKLELRPSDHLLEIGTGWGALAAFAAKEHGCRVTSVTISREQHAAAVERVRREGVSDRVSVLLHDYRDVKGSFDALVSVEMIEAVGDRRLGEFFRTCGSLLVPEGRMALQAITIRDCEFERHLRSVDFIKAHVFPGSCIPSTAALLDRVARETDLRLVHLEDLTPHYVRTLREWRHNLEGGWRRLRERGYSEEMLRGFEFYLAYCEAGFAERYLGDVQALLVRPGWRGAAPLPALV